MVMARSRGIPTLALGKREPDDSCYATARLKPPGGPVEVRKSRPDSGRSHHPASTPGGRRLEILFDVVRDLGERLGLAYIPTCTVVHRNQLDFGGVCNTEAGGQSGGQFH